MLLLDHSCCKMIDKWKHTQLDVLECPSQKYQTQLSDSKDAKYDYYDGRRHSLSGSFIPVFIFQRMPFPINEYIVLFFFFFYDFIQSLLFSTPPSNGWMNCICVLNCTSNPQWPLLVCSYYPRRLLMPLHEEAVGSPKKQTSTASVCALWWMHRLWAWFELLEFVIYHEYASVLSVQSRTGDGVQHACKRKVC